MKGQRACSSTGLKRARESRYQSADVLIGSIPQRMRLLEARLRAREPRVSEASRSPVGSVSEESERSGQPELEVVSMRTSEAQQRSSREDEPAPSPTPSLSASIIDHFADFELRNSMVEWPDSPPISPANASGADGPSSSPSRKSRVRVSSQERRRSMDYI